MPLLRTSIALAALQVALGQDAFSGCFGESKFVVVNESLPFVDAVASCEALGGVLAVPFSTGEHDFIMGLVSGNLDPATNVWLGNHSLPETVALETHLS